MNMNASQYDVYRPIQWPPIDVSMGVSVRGSPSPTETAPFHRDPPSQNFPSPDKDLLEETWNKTARQKLTSYKDPKVNRQTWVKNYLAQAQFAGGNEKYFLEPVRMFLPNFLISQVFYPSDDINVWTSAKLWFNLADGNFHQAVTHMGKSLKQH